MLHAWTIPAGVDGAPYVDASYTCACPALELAALGHAQVIAVSVDPSPLSHDLFARADPFDVAGRVDRGDPA
jgi:hypothetical protein